MIRIIILAGLSAAAFALTGCQSGPVEAPHSAFGAEPLEPVLAWRENAAGDLVIRVQSNGCTTKDSFQVEVTGSAAAGWTFDVALTRLHADRCRALLPQGAALTWTKDELGLPPGAGLNVVNPVSSSRPPLRPYPPQM